VLTAVSHPQDVNMGDMLHLILALMPSVIYDF
jgi:hypothetical protein